MKVTRVLIACVALLVFHMAVGNSSNTVGNRHEDESKDLDPSESGKTLPVVVSRSKRLRQNLKRNMPIWVVLVVGLLLFWAIVSAWDFAWVECLANLVADDDRQKVFKNWSPFLNWVGALLVALGGALQFRATNTSPSVDGSDRAPLMNYPKWGAGLVALGGIIVALGAAFSFLVIPA